MIAFAHWQKILPFLIGLAIAAVLWPLRMSFAFDDAYITFRYSENVAHGYGIVWNIYGPHTEGYTNFLLVLLLTPFSILGSDLLTASQIIGVVATILTAYIIHEFLSRVIASRVISLASAILYLLLPFTWANAFSGLETSLFVFFATASFYFAYRKFFAAAFILASLAALTRPDGALVGIVLGVAFLFHSRDRRRALKALGIYFVIPMLLYAAFKWLYFGDIFPNSWYVKTSGHGLRGVPNIKTFLIDNVLLFLLAGYAVIKRWDRAKVFIPMLVFSALILTFYLWPEHLQGFYFRFVWTAAPVLVILAALAFSNVRWNPLVLSAVAVLQILISVPVLRRDMQLATLEKGRQIYYELGMELRSIPHHESMTFAFQDAGAVPYYSEMQHIDIVGLNTTAIAKAHSDSEACEIVAQSRPDILFVPAYRNNTMCWTLFHEGHGKASGIISDLLHHPVMAEYRSIGSISYLGYDILCYARTDAAPAVSAALLGHDWFRPGPIPCVE